MTEATIAQSQKVDELIVELLKTPHLDLEKKEALVKQMTIEKAKLNRMILKEVV